MCHVARQQELEWIWIDTCCIDKSSSAELSEAINSMFEWYKRAAACYVYLYDVSSNGKLAYKALSFASSRWFIRGWTLQELLAASKVYFYDQCWNCVHQIWKADEEDVYPLQTHPEEIQQGTSKSDEERPRHLSFGAMGPTQQRPEFNREGTFDMSSNDFIRVLSDITTIDIAALSTQFDVVHQNFSVAKKMSWAAKRETTRLEDKAYSLMGLFNVNMPLLYGEEEKAFFRLQEEIIKKSDDESNFFLGFRGAHSVCGRIVRQVSRRFLRVSKHHKG
ncbi:hypothetical protein BDP81DRAFT_440360 [Colletotrichum phormii]|uniref:Heterokaryon incompatibility domain-containing protein n=1 Tax=Colletotrichum phormii TaxID=359342 RepID=A0AAI9ZE36_9PEZI|nr:uncharacterized protein BDP81DRAFT_440360 [Colletotrichum phormii]KAK1622849.1 hypothetical protein BDP81DRAFT_440360 [Colletotrichum phormii]